MSKFYSRREPLLTISMFKERFLFGVDLRDGDGNVLPDTTIESFINVAIDYIEQNLEAPISPPQSFTEYLDYKYNEYQSFAYMQLYHYPIVSIDSVKLIWGDPTNPDIELEFPNEWYKIYETSGQIQLLPTASTLNAVILTRFGRVLPHAIPTKYAPQLIEVKGNYGICDEADKVPPLVNQAIGLMAAIYMLQMLGDIGPAGPGVASTSIGVDGLSQSLSTAISATSNLFQATISSYKDLLHKDVLKRLKQTFKRIKLEYI